MNDRQKKTYTVQELADLVGVSASALRAWERRYGFFSPDRTAGGHRVYTQDDLKLFWYVSHLRGQGWDLKKVAQLGRATLVLQACEFYELRVVTEENTGPSIATPCEEILRCLRRADVENAISGLEKLYALSTSALQFADLALEIMQYVGEAWHRGEITVAAEHGLTARVKHLLLGLLYMNSSLAAAQYESVSGTPHAAQDPGEAHVPRAPLALCAALPDELHELGLLRVAIYLKQWGFRIVYLGPNTPVADIDDHVNRTRPQLLVVSSATPIASNHAHLQFQKLSMIVAPKVLTVVGGAGVRTMRQHPEFANMVLTESIDELRKIADACRTQAVQGLPRLLRSVKGLGC